MAPAKSVSFCQFFYRRNSDNSIDAICGYCLLTVATADTETEIQARTSSHVCNPEAGKAKRGQLLL